jgi:hypothetical protein
MSTVNNARPLPEQTLTAARARLDQLSRHTGLNMRLAITRGRSGCKVELDSSSPQAVRPLSHVMAHSNEITAWLAGFERGWDMGCDADGGEAIPCVTLVRTGELVHVFLSTGDGNSKPLDDPRLPAFSVERVLGLLPELVGPKFRVTVQQSVAV